MASDRNSHGVPTWLRRAALAFVLLAITIVAQGLISRATQNSHLRALTAAEAMPNVAVVVPSTVDNLAGLELPGRLEAYIPSFFSDAQRQMEQSFQKALDNLPTR